MHRKRSKQHSKALCFRCEHRAHYLETGKGPRCECEEATKAVDNCYYYAPVKPCMLKWTDGDRRLLGAGLNGCWVKRVPSVSMCLALRKYKGGRSLLYQIPDEREGGEERATVHLP